MTEIAVRTPMDQLVAKIEHPSFIEQVEKSLPENVTPARFVQVTLTAIRSDPAIITKDENSLFGAIVKCAQDGLLPDGREAAFVAFGNAISYMPMIGGFRKIAAEHGWAIDTQVVYENDDFEWELGQHPRLHHKPAGLEKEPGEKIGAYAVATHEDGRKLVEVMRKSDILKVRGVSRAKSNGPWVDWEERMWEKTVGRRIFGKIPLSGRGLEVARRLMRAHDDEYDLGNGPRMTVDEANIAQPLSNLTAPKDSGPDDQIEEGVLDYGETVVTSGAYEGRTFAEVVQDADGAAWMRTRLKTLAADHALRAPLEAFVQAELPEVWTAYMEWRQGQ